MSLPKRTAKDEADYGLNLQREEPIKTEVIVELHEQNIVLWQSQARLLRALLEAQDSLRVYREQQWTHATRMAESSAHCVPGCTRHEWHADDGWHRTNGDK